MNNIKDLRKYQRLSRNEQLTAQAREIFKGYPKKYPKTVLKRFKRMTITQSLEEDKDLVLYDILGEE